VTVYSNCPDTCTCGHTCKMFYTSEKSHMSVVLYYTLSHVQKTLFKDLKIMYFTPPFYFITIFPTNLFYRDLSLQIINQSIRIRWINFLSNLSYYLTTLQLQCPLTGPSVVLMIQPIHKCITSLLFFYSFSPILFFLFLLFLFLSSFFILNSKGLLADSSIVKIWFPVYSLALLSPWVFLISFPVFKQLNRLYFYSQKWKWQSCYTLFCSAVYIYIHFMLPFYL